MLCVGVVAVRLCGLPIACVCGRFLCQLSTFLSHLVSGTGGVIYAQAHLGRALLAENFRHFRRHQDAHRVFTNNLPYKKTYLIPILTLKKIKRPYVHPRGAIGIVKYVPPNVSV